MTFQFKIMGARLVQPVRWLALDFGSGHTIGVLSSCSVGSLLVPSLPSAPLPPFCSSPCLHSLSPSKIINKYLNKY